MELTFLRELLLLAYLCGQNETHHPLTHSRTASRLNTMPIKWILHWKPNLGTTVNTQTLSEVSQCAETINGVNEGRWKTTLSFYKAMVRGNQYQLGDFQWRVGKVVQHIRKTCGA